MREAQFDVNESVLDEDELGAAQQGVYEMIRSTKLWWRMNMDTGRQQKGQG